MRVLAASLRALLGCFDFVLGLLSDRGLGKSEWRGKRKVALQDVALFPCSFVMFAFAFLTPFARAETVPATNSYIAGLSGQCFGAVASTPLQACINYGNICFYSGIDWKAVGDINGGKCIYTIGNLTVDQAGYYGTPSSCPSPDWSLSGSTCTRVGKNLGQPTSCTDTPTTAKPIVIGTGNKFLSESDYIGTGTFPFQFTRSYNSRQDGGGAFGFSWRPSYGGTISQIDSSTVLAYRPDGKILTFNFANGIWVAAPDINDQLQQISTGWIYTAADNTIENFLASGKRTSFINRAGFTQQYTLSTGSDGNVYLDANGNPTTAALPADELLSITDSSGRMLRFGVDVSHRIVKITDPAQGVYLYRYDASNNLSSVTYPDGKTKTYLYGETAFTSGTTLPHALTGIIDENGTRYVSYYYDALGRAYKEELAPGLNQGIYKHQLTYNTDASGNPISTVVTDPLGTQRTYNFSTILGVVKSTGSTQPGGSGCGAASINQTYDANGNVYTRTDFNGNSTTYNQYDLTRNLELSRTEAVGRPEARTITTTWHPTFRLPTSITEPGRVTTNIYDPTSGNLLSRAIRDTASGKSRTVTYTYTTADDGTLANLLKSVDGPRTDVADITTYTYYPNGDLQSVRNALNHETRITQYDPHGRPQTIIDPNSIVTELTYWPRGWLKTRAVAGETSNYDYDGVGQITKVTAPDGSFISYTYDDAHRLTDIYDAQGNRIRYTLDPIGNRTKEEVFNNLGALITTKSRVFDALNRLWKDIGALNQTTTFEYDANGNLKKIDGPLTTQNDVTVNNYDALNRLATSTDGLNGITRYGYDALDQLRSVTDPRNLITSYAVNALGEQSQLASPDTGTTNSLYDAAGNLSSRTDADGKIVSYSYDALNRVTAIQHNSTPQYTYTYDQGPYAIGKLSSISGGGTTTTWTYNAQGRMQNKVQQTGAVSLTTIYAYNPSGQLTSMTYPSGKIVAYGYNSLGQIASISVNGQPVINNASYQAFGPVARWNWGNNSPYVRSFDTDGRLSSYPLGNFNTRSLGFDDASRIQNQTETTPVANTFFNYDELDRLKSWIPPNGNQSYDYDANGNRTRLVIGANSYTNTLSTTSNRLQSVAGPSAKTYSYNLSGNRINDGTNSFSYDSAQRLTNVTFPGGNSAYNINALGQRTLKSGTGVTTTHFTYDEMGKLMGEYNATGQPIEETLYLGDLPVAVLR